MTPSSRKGRGEHPLTSVETHQALANPWRFRIVMELNRRPMSVAQFVEEVGGEQSNISRRFKQLAEWGYIELVEEKSGGRRRGGVERIYRSTLAAPRIDSPAWAKLPQMVRNDISQNVLDVLMARVGDALEAGTFDREVDRHLAWMPATFDGPGLRRLAGHLDEIIDLVPEIEQECIDRIARRETTGFPITVGLLAFRSPPDDEEPSGE